MTVYHTIQPFNYSTEEAHYLPLDGMVNIHIYLSSLGILGKNQNYFPKR